MTEREKSQNDPWTCWTPPDPADQKKAEDDIRKWIEANIPPGAELCFESRSEYFEGEEAFALMFGWMPPERQKEWRDIIFGKSRTR